MGLITLSILINVFINKYLLIAQIVEWVWTLIPAFILIQVAIPSLLLLYIIDESVDSSLTIKVMGHQWYWSYEYGDMGDTQLGFDSYITQLEDGEKNIFRLLDVDNRVIFPTGVHTRILVSSIDVLHAWTVPVLGVKADAVPGRLNQIKFISQRPGVYYGQCSEICGANHSFIPIVVEMVRVSEFKWWVALNYLQ